jgi:hypothetical protein
LDPIYKGQWKIVTAGGQSNYYNVSDAHINAGDIGAALPCIENHDKVSRHYSTGQWAPIVASADSVLDPYIA